MVRSPGFPCSEVPSAMVVMVGVRRNTDVCPWGGAALEGSAWRLKGEVTAQTGLYAGRSPWEALGGPRPRAPATRAVHFGRAGSGWQGDVCPWGSGDGSEDTRGSTHELVCALQLSVQDLHDRILIPKSEAASPRPRPCPPQPPGMGSHPTCDITQWRWVCSFSYPYLLHGSGPKC